MRVILVILIAVMATGCSILNHVEDQWNTVVYEIDKHTLGNLGFNINPVDYQRVMSTGELGEKYGKFKPTSQSDPSLAKLLIESKVEGAELNLKGAEQMFSLSLNHPKYFSHAKEDYERSVQSAWEALCSLRQFEIDFPNQESEWRQEQMGRFYATTKQFSAFSTKLKHQEEIFIKKYGKKKMDTWEEERKKFWSPDS